MSKNINVPKLRFKEFSGEWEEKKLSDICEKIGDGIHSTPKYDDKGLFYFVNGNNLSNGVILITENTKKVNEKEYFKHKRQLGKNTILLSINGTIGNVAFYNNEQIVLGKSACYININENKTNKYFINDILKTSHIQNFFYSEVTGSTIKNLSLSTIKNTKLNLPSKNEQEKIASFLSSIDNKIEQLSKKDELMASYKKGVMQKIFSQEIRFKDNDEELRTGKIKDFGFFYYGKGAPKTSVTKDAKTPCVRYGELYSTYKEHIKQIKSYTNVDPKDLKLSKGGEILVPRVGEDPLDFANCSYLPIAGVAIGEMISVYNTKENGLFMTYYINSMLKKQFAKVVEGGNVSNLYFKYLEDINISIPSFEEQTKIANFLSSIDTKISQNKKALEETKKFKKALLQQMFV